MSKMIKRTVAFMVALLFLMSMVFENSDFAYAASDISQEPGSFSEKTQELLDVLNEAYPGYFCYVPEDERDSAIPSYDLTEEELYEVLMSLNVTQELLFSGSSKSISPSFENQTGDNGTRSALYGAAVPYYYNTSTSVNCYGYAMIQPLFVNPGYMTGSYSSGVPVSTIASNVISDYNARGLGARTIAGGLSGVSSNEYRIATRTGSGYISGVPVYDYHFMRQTDIGEWAEKRGSAPSVNRGAIDPATASWNLYNTSGSIEISNFYNSATYFLAVRLY